MALESLIALGLATAFLAGLAWYATRHRAEDKRHGSARRAPTV
jgi:hypothetical protein